MQDELVESGDFKDVTHRDGITSKCWVSMGKSISNHYRYAEISKAANSRFPDSMCNIIPIRSIEKFQLFEFTSDGKYLIRSFTNQEINRAINIPHSRRYLVSGKGRCVLGGIIETKRKLYPEFAAI